MDPSISFGKVTDLHESLNGNNGTIVYLSDRDEAEVQAKYESIKAAKSILAAYGMNSRHYLVLMVGGKVKKVLKKQKNK